MSARYLSILLILVSAFTAFSTEPVGDVVFLRYITLPYGPRGDGSRAVILRLTNHSPHPISYFGLSPDVPMFLIQRRTEQGWTRIRQTPFSGGSSQRLLSGSSVEFVIYVPSVSSVWRVGIPYSLQHSMRIDQPTTYRGPFLWSRAIPKPPK